MTGIKRSLSTRILSVFLVTVAGLAINELSALELNRSFSNDMVLQRDKPVKVWGTAKKGETITVSFAGQKKSAKADESGRWVVTLDPMKANSKGQTLKVTLGAAKRSEDGSTLTNVVVGDVFLFARQSSIDVSLGTTPEGKKAAGKANKSFRFIRIKTSPSRTPLGNLKEDATSGWKVVDKKSALTMSGAAFYLGCDLAREIDVPVGMVDLDMGYHLPGAWLSERGVAQCEGKDEDGDVLAQLKKLPIEYEKWDALTEEPSDQLPPAQRAIAPSVCYNAVIHPLRGLAVRGMLLQLGNDYPFFTFNRFPKKDGNSHIYEIIKQGNRMTPVVLPAAMEDLRSTIGGPSLPLGWIMPPGSDHYLYGLHNREIRELQRRTVAKSKGVDLILPGPGHVRKSGQPADEALLADRCKQWALSAVYGSGQPATGPVFDQVKFEKGVATISFGKGTAGGLAATPEALKQFEMGDDKGKFSSCHAEIKGETIVLRSDTLVKPVFVRYGWNHKPGQGLVNKAGLPAAPFNTDGFWEYDWWIQDSQVELPVEYKTNADKWPSGNVLIANGMNKLLMWGNAKTPHMGPTGLWVAGFGPNLYVHKTTPGSPADGKLFKGDLIFGVNGKRFTTEPDNHYRTMAAGITQAETKEGGGRMVLNIVREGKVIEVPLQLEVMGSFSETSPWDCEKSRRIVAKAEDYLRKGLRPETGIPDDDTYMYPPWHDNAFFLLASGNPELQGLVRRHIRQAMDRLDAEKAGDKKAFKNYNRWGNYLLTLFAEYYHRTGDPSVLPYMQYMVDRFPPKRGRTKTDSFVMPAATLADLIGLVLAREAGVKMDSVALYELLDYFYYKRGENACIMYEGYPKGGVFPRPTRDKPEPIDPRNRDAGLVKSWNGKLGTAAVLYSLVEGRDKAVKECSKRCAYAFNRTRSGHGGAWFNNYWTPIGAYHAGKEKYQKFMKGQQWWRELYRCYDGSIWQAGHARDKKDWNAVGYVIHRVAHRKNLRIFGAPRSVFCPGAPAYLKDALSAHRERDYARAEKLIQKVLKQGKIPAKEQPMVNHFLDAVQMLQKSIEHDLAYTEDLLKRNEIYIAELEYTQLKMVVSPDNTRLKKIAEALESEAAKTRLAAILKEGKEQEKLRWKEERRERDAQWRRRDYDDGWTDDKDRLVTFTKDPVCSFGRSRGGVARFSAEESALWRVTDFESGAFVPKNWEQPGFDDSGWRETKPAVTWRPGCVGLLRTTFEVEDPDAFEGLQARLQQYKCVDMQVYLNGRLIGKANDMTKRQLLLFKPYAKTLLKKGKNTLAIRSQHGVRWTSVYFRLEGRLKAKAE